MPTTTTSTTTTLPPASTSTIVSNANGVVTIKGRGSRAVALPAAVPLPAIVHAEHAGKSSFAISGLDATGRRTSVLATSLGTYDGTFPVGFVGQRGDPVVALRVSTRGTWQIDVGSALLAPQLGAGRSGVGDTVLAYDGPGATAHLTYGGRARLVVNMYDNGGLIPLVATTGPYDGPISLVAGPAFISVTTTGNWSMIIE